jgi:hypothetical protein
VDRRGWNCCPEFPLHHGAVTPGASLGLMPDA